MLTYRVFPATTGSTAITEKNRKVPPAGAECFYCDGEIASASCGSCGRFLCRRCEVSWSGEVTCLACVHANREVRDVDAFRNRRMLYDNLALLLLVWPLFLPVWGIAFSAMTAPFALYFALRYWKASRGIVPRGRGRLILATVFSILLIVGAFVAFGTLFYL